MSDSSPQTSPPQPSPAAPDGLLLPPDRASALDRETAGWGEVALSPAQLSALELRMNLPQAGSAIDVLDLPAPAGAAVGDRLALRDPEGVLLATLTVASVEGGRVRGDVVGVRLPAHPDAAASRRTPAQLDAEIRRRGWTSVHTQLTARPLFEADLERLSDALRGTDGVVVALLAGGVEATDPEHHTRLAALRAGLATLPENRVLLTVLPLVRDASDEQRYAVAEGYGLAGRAGRKVELAPAPGSPDDATVRAELERNPADARPSGGTPRPDVVLDALRRTHRPRSRQGFTVFFTGLSGSGKSTVAGLLAVRLLELTDRSVLLLDGDRVRRHLTAGLGFSRADRTMNVRRIGWTATQVSAAGGIAVCAPIAPYDSTRREVRAMVDRVSPAAGFVLVHIATPLEECERRDRKGLYARARAGEIPEFTGISDPYEVPEDAEVVADTTGRDPAAVVEQVVQHLRDVGYLTD